MKSSIWLIDLRPDPPTIVRKVEQGFELSEASNAPVMLDLPVRACHLTGKFVAKDNRPGAYSGRLCRRRSARNQIRSHRFS